jgi:hypothetical protein
MDALSHSMISLIQGVIYKPHPSHRDAERYINLRGRYADPGRGVINSHLVCKPIDIFKDILGIVFREDAHDSVAVDFRIGAFVPQVKLFIGGLVKVENKLFISKAGP